jgi:ceramide glucosyltransferase
VLYDPVSTVRKAKHTCLGEEIVGVNPKVNNLVRPFRQAAHDILWVLDSGVLVDEGTLARSVGFLTTTASSIGLVHHVPFALFDKTKIGSQLEGAFLNTNHAKMYIAINTVGVESCVVGKSNLYRRSDVEKLNASFIPVRSQVLKQHDPTAVYGLTAFGRFLAEDNSIASAIWHELGLRHDLSCDVARNVIGSMSFLDYVWRRVRWIRVRKHMVLTATLLEPFTESVVLCAVGAFSCANLFGVPLWVFTLFHFPFWLYVDLDVYASIGGHKLRKEDRVSFVLAWMGREILAFPIWVIAVFGNEVTWRGQRYRILRNGLAYPCGEQRMSVSLSSISLDKNKRPSQI